jgi:hypothetical protein
MRTAFIIKAIILLKEAVRNSETSVYFYKTIWHRIPETFVTVSTRNLASF